LSQFASSKFLEKASHWFLKSGIQTPSGGVARFYKSDSGQNAPVSNEITGYAASAFAYLGEQEAARRAARFLACQAWDGTAMAFPFEPQSNLAYFFDTGIIARGLLAVWRGGGEDLLQSRAGEAALSLAFDFLGEGEFHPVIELPEKQPASRDPRWSRSPGCYQLKSALAWKEVGDPDAERIFETALASALATHESFLATPTDRSTAMDRLHPYCYFLEALLWVADREAGRGALEAGIPRVAARLRDIAPEFERSDVWAQLLRVRLIAHHLHALPLDAAAAAEEAARLAEFQAESSDPRIDGGFWFGRRGADMLPFVNPVSTAFGMQALALWHQHAANDWRFALQDLI
jgi:hypothetical protein